MRRSITCPVMLACLPAVVGLLATPAVAHDIEHYPAIVIDTDMGLDDAVTLALALQSPRARIIAIVACEGAASGDRSTDHLERMLQLFNRHDIPLYAPAQTGVSKTPPSFRDFAEQSVGAALPILTEPFRRPFSPEAYSSKHGKTVVLALGPLTNLAAALEAKPAIKDDIAKLIVAGSPEVSESWNARFDPDAFAAVQAAGIPTDFVMPDATTARKPQAWRTGPLKLGQSTSIGADFVQRLLESPRVREHYTQALDTFHDELAFLYYADASLFWGRGRADVLAPNNQAGIVNLLTRLISDGRQGKDRVVFVTGSLPDAILQKDVRERKARIIANNGRTEWFAQLLMNELHQHLGVYSVLGVKMGLRAAELLNAPQHGMKIISHVPPRPPFSCLNDGLIVATGCTPGRGRFTHAPETPEVVAVTFECNGRRIRVALKREYRAQVAASFKALLDKHTLEDHDYWHGVRQLGLEIWENWHRRELFEIVADSPRPN